MITRILAGLTLLIGMGVSQAPAVAETDTPPAWAWGFSSPDTLGTPLTAEKRLNPAAGYDSVTRYKVAGSRYSFSRAQISNPYGPADWFPEDHPPMPEIVAHGRQSASPPIWACGLCHLPEGKGRPENANVTGLTYEYIVQQLMDFRTGARQSSDPRKTNTGTMAEFARIMTDDEIKAAATYFAALPATPWTKVLETDTVPKTKGTGGVFLKLTGAEAGFEPIGQRIIETPANAEEAEIRRNPRSGFIAYVPRGSLKKGEELVTTGAGKTTKCTVCHGPELRGLGPVPRLAGRSPSYIVRQLYDMQHGNRTGLWSPLMTPVLDSLDPDDLLNAAAYLASLDP